MTMSGVSLLIPCFNEELTVAQTINEFAESLDRTGLPYEILVVDNNSTDRTAELAKAAIASRNSNGFVIAEPRQGKGYAVRTGIMNCRYDVLVMTDGDATYSAENLPQMISLVASEGIDMVVGDRLSGGVYSSQNDRGGHSFGNRIFSWFASQLYKTSLIDVFSGLRVFSRPFFQTYPNTSRGFEIEIDLTLHALDKRLRIEEIPVLYRQRPVGSTSKLSTIKDGTRVLVALFACLKLYRPMLVFGGFSIILGTLGVLCGLPSIVEYVESGYVSRLPLAVLAVGFEVLSGLSLAVALILDSVASLSRREFELHYLSVKNPMRRPD